MVNKVTIYVGDVRERISDIREEINLVLSSPPYFSQRCYLNEDNPDKSKEIGLEETPELFVETMVGLFSQIKEKMRDDGALFLNLGDSYAGSAKGRNADGTHGMLPEDSKQRSNRGSVQGIIPKTATPNHKSKDLIGIPWMVAFGLQKEGWYFRQDICLEKLNPFPESVKDRFTKAHEYMFMLSKSRRYYFDSEAAKEPTADGKDLRNKRSVWKFALNPYKDIHTATFSIEMITTPILCGSRENDTVFDPFGGSGTTALTALLNNRNAVLCELNQEFVDVTINRLLKEAPNGTEIEVDYGDKIETQIVSNTVRVDREDDDLFRFE